MLLDEEIFPVCSPRLFEGRPALETPDDLRHYPLLHDMTAWRGSPPYAEWERYLRATQHAGSDPSMQARRDQLRWRWRLLRNKVPRGRD